jgi:aryl-alcohol dehydrogenase-like predicted oxidoreductase
MGMSEAYGASNEAESLATIHQALDWGINFFDTADLYGDGAAEQLVGKALRGRRDQAIFATKFGFVRDRTTRSLTELTGKPEYVKRARAALRRTNV